MKTLSINNETYNIPQAWEEITIEKQLTVESFAKDYPDLPQVCVIAGYCNRTIEEIKKLHINTVSEILKELQFIKTPLSNNPIYSFIHKGHEYFVIPSILAGQFQDYISLETIREQYQQNLYKALPLLVAILAKRKDETLDNYDVMERAKEFNDLPITIANSLYTFFLTSAILLNPDYQPSVQELNQNILQSTDYIKTTLNKQVGKGWLSRLQNMILRRYISFIESRWNKLYSGYNSKQENQN